MNVYDRIVDVRFNGTELLSIAADSLIEFPEMRARNWMAEHDSFAFLVGIFYVISVFSLKRYMRDREAFDLSTTLKFWNGFLAITSIMGSVAMAPEFFDTLFNKGVTEALCQGRSFFTGTNGFIVWLFHLSKMIELFDTYFIVLRKRPLIFLHWFHHLLTLYFTWYQYPALNSFTRFGIFGNVTVHGFMYSYYFISTFGIKLPKFIAQSVTSLQLLQFAVNMWSLIHVTYLSAKFKDSCHVDMDVYAFSWFVDIVYIYLFTRFYLNSYIYKKKKTAKEE